MNPAKPTVLRKLQGVPGHARPLNKNEANLPPTLPDAPGFLGKLAAEEWKRLGSQLEAAGLISTIDRNQFAAYCIAYGLWAENVMYVSKFGPFTKTQGQRVLFSKQFALMQEAQHTMLELAREFGLTPSARSRISVAPAKLKDAFEAYLDGET